MFQACTFPGYLTAQRITIDEQTDDDVMHLRRFRKVDGHADHTFHARSYSQMPALDVLGVAFAWAMHVRIQMSDVCAPIIGVAAGEPAGLSSV